MYKQEGNKTIRVKRQASQRCPSKQVPIFFLSIKVCLYEKKWSLPISVPEKHNSLKHEFTKSKTLLGRQLYYEFVMHVYINFCLTCWALWTKPPVYHELSLCLVFRVLLHPYNLTFLSSMKLQKFFFSPLYLKSNITTIFKLFT